MTTAVRSRSLRLAPAAAALVAVQVVVLAASAPALLRAMASNADLASPLVMGEAAGAYPGSELVAGNYAWWNGLWATQLLSRLPGGGTLMEVVPLLVTLAVVAGLAVLARALWRPRSALAVALVLLAVGPAAWTTYAAWSSRAPTWWAMAGVLAVVVAAARTPALLTWPAWLAGAALAVLWGAAALAGDPLAWLVVVGPLVAVALSAAGARAWRVVAVALAMAAAIAVLSPLVHALAHAAGYRYAPAPLPLSDPIGLYRGLANAVVGTAEVWRGPGDGALSHAAGLLGVTLAGLALVAGVVLLAVRRPAGLTGAAADRETARRAWTAFWLGALLLSLAGFAGTTVSGPLGDPIVRYLLAVPFAAAGLLAAAAGHHVGGARAVAPLAALLAALATLALATGDVRERPAMHREAVRAIEAAVQRYDLDVGYASYWTAAPLAHALGDPDGVQPAGMCTGSTRARPRLCPAQLHYVQDALRPRPGARSYVLVDASPFARFGYRPSWVTQLPAGVRPERVLPVGDGLRMAIYDEDVARVLGPFNRFVR